MFTAQILLDDVAWLEAHEVQTLTRSPCTVPTATSAVSYLLQT